ncbi:uncharacterized protein LOC127839744 [Dreissena polymorpha]|uniref:uncharacterized protein LOC127839744 n=1 Tax=Dreissena polymorpha TaxID=45954 RepID=UPI0022652039|nr:uncharacterized protein LOC127839744 [Dreissena polymorpha]
MASIAKRKRTLSIEEKSKRRKDAKTSYNLGRITIGSEIVSISSCGKKVEQKAKTSTLFKTRPSVFEPPVSGISSISSEAERPDDVNQKYEEAAFEEEAFGKDGCDDDAYAEEESADDDPCPGIQRLKTEAHSVHLIGSAVCFAYVSAILSLARIKVMSCSVTGCTDPTNICVTDYFIGSALYLKWVCGGGHILNRWCAQPVLNRRLHGGDLMFALSTLTSGNNFGKLALWAKHMNFKIMSSTSFHKIQRTYLISTVDEYWEKQQREVLSSFEGHKLIVMGDGRNDSPGHSAQYCSYTMMEYDSKKFLTLRTLDKRSTDRKSTNMEKVGLEQAIQELTDNNIAVEEVVTDAHLGIGSIMKKKDPEIKHSHDIWHAAKNLGKRLGKIVKKKANQILIPWLKDIVNHFWFACSKADSYEEFLSIWRGVLHHITNKHE